MQSYNVGLVDPDVHLNDTEVTDCHQQRSFTGERPGYGDFADLDSQGA